MQTFYICKLHYCLLYRTEGTLVLKVIYNSWQEAYDRFFSLCSLKHMAYLLAEDLATGLVG